MEWCIKALGSAIGQLIMLALSLSLMHTHTDAEAGSLQRSEADKVNSGYSISPCFQRWTWRSYLTEENKLIKVIQTKGQNTASSRTRHKSDVHMVNRFTVKAKVEDAFHFYFSCAAFSFFSASLYLHAVKYETDTQTPSWRSRMEDSSIIQYIKTLSDWFIVLSHSVCVCMYKLLPVQSGYRLVGRYSISQPCALQVPRLNYCVQCVLGQLI